MKQKTLLLLLAVFSCLGNMYAQESLTFNDITVNKGARAGTNDTLTVTANLSSRNFYTAYQISFNLPKGITINSVEKGSFFTVKRYPALALGHSENTVTAVQPAGNIDDLKNLYNSNSNAKEICNIVFYCDETVEEGVYEIECSFVEFTKKITTTDPNTGQQISNTIAIRPLEDEGLNFSVGTFTITVKDEYDPMILSEENVDAPATQTEAKELKVTRKLSSSNWNTICLPFAMTEDQIYEVFGYPEIAEFIGVETSNSDGVKNVTLNFDPSIEEMEANVPYLIKPEKDISEFKCLAQIETDESNAKVTVDGCTFYGTLHAGVKIPVNNIFLSGNKFYYATSETKSLKGFRGYFDITNALKSFNQANIKMMVGDEEVTGIEGVIFNGETVEEETPIYSISGVYMGTEREKLPSGIYITNKKKFIVK